ncbi:MAG: N-acetyltransferase family protein, partial [Gammaproteobacteria bacterium]
MSTAHDLEPFLKETNVQIRDALDTDLEGILQIYNDAVENSTAIWNDRTVDLDNRRAWLAERHDQ